MQNIKEREMAWRHIDGESDGFVIMLLVLNILASVNIHSDAR